MTRFSIPALASVSVLALGLIAAPATIDLQDEVIGAKRSDITHEAREATQQILDAYQCGIVVPSLQLQRVVPPAALDGRSSARGAGAPG